LRGIRGRVLWFLWGIYLSYPGTLGSSSLLASPQFASAAPQPPLFAFAQSLFAAGEYYRAIGEFQRFLFFQPGHPLTSEAQLTIGLAFFCGERWLQAFEVFRRITRTASDNAMRQEAALWMAETHARGGDQMEAIRLFQELIRQYPDSRIAQRAAYLIGWGYVRQRRWIEARDAFAQVDAASPYHASGERMAAALATPPELPHRSPTVARVLSTVLPGAGQIYTGHTLDGLIGLGLHGALIAGTIGGVGAGLEGAAGIGAFFTWGFYRTQMSNAATLARDFNAHSEERFIGQLAAQEGPFLHAYARSIPCMPSSPLVGRRP
jgi:TolA-binding protein/TM2 domain-containing membrane protein YozV